MTLYHYSTCVLLHHCPLHDHLTPTTGCGKCQAISCGKCVWIGKVTCLWYTCKIVAILSSACIYSCSLLIPKWSVSDMGLELYIKLTLKSWILIFLSDIWCHCSGKTYQPGAQFSDITVSHGSHLLWESTWTAASALYQVPQNSDCPILHGCPTWVLLTCC